MYLLNRKEYDVNEEWLRTFTFHYVSIKSSRKWLIHPKCTIQFTFHYVSIKSSRLIFSFCSQPYLHSTMYLLNHRKTERTAKKSRFTFHYVSIKSNRRGSETCQAQGFTFHYVSIKSATHTVLILAL